MKLNKLSLKWKLFFAVIIFALVIVCIFIVFQIGMLGNFYRTRKIKKTTALVNKVSNIVASHEAVEFSQKIEVDGVVSELDKLSADEEIAIYLITDISNFASNEQDEHAPSTTKTEIINNGWVYKTYQGESYSKLGYQTIRKIREQAEKLELKNFYAVILNAPDPTIDDYVQVFDTQMPKKKLQKILASQTKTVMCCSFVDLVDGTDCLLIIDNKLVPVDAAVNTMKLQLMYITLIVIVLATMIAILLSKYISKPISKLNSTAKLMAAGNYDVVFEGNGYLEVNELNKTLNNTVSELKKTETLRRELMANVSHDLRTPLTMIMGYAEMMRDIPGENSPENLKIIIDEVDRLNVLVNDMLDLSKLSANTAVMHPQIFCVTDNLIEIVDRIQKFNENQGTNIKLQYDQNVEVCADESKIEQVICNFIYNAINYSSPSSLIRVVQEVNGDVVRISVIDEGIGIKEEDLKIDVYRSSGCGGQGVNTTDSAVRITHLPTKIVVTCQNERSQIQNKEQAMKVLKARLYDLEQQKHDQELGSERRSKIGTGDRAEKIRTYNYPQNRVTDHRIGFTTNSLDRVMNGQLDEIIDALTMEDQRRKLAGEEA